MSFHGGESFAPLAVQAIAPPLCLWLRAALQAVASDTRLRAQSLSCQRKAAAPGGKENALCRKSLPLRASVCLLRESLVRTAEGSGCLLPDALHSFPRESASPHLVALVFTLGGQGQSALLTPLPLPHPPGRGIQRGGAAAPPL